MPTLPLLTFLDKRLNTWTSMGISQLRHHKKETNPTMDVALSDGEL